MPIKRLAIVVVILAAAAAVAYRYPPLSSPPTDSGDLVLYGNIDIRQADLAFNSDGRIDTMVVDEGDAVSKGQLLATLESSRYEAAAAAARAQVASQKAILDRLLAGSRPEEIAMARADVKALEAERHNAETTLKRVEKLAIDRFAPLQRLDDTRTALKSATARLDAAKQELELAVKGPRAEDIAEARAQLKNAEAELDLAQQRLKDTQLYAKDNGVVLTRILEPGAVVLAHTPAYTISIANPLWARTYVAEPDLGHVHPGMKAVITTDSQAGKTYDGWVGFISPVAEFTPKTVETTELRTSLVYRLRVYVTAPDRGLRQGMPVTIKLVTKKDAAAASDDG